MPPCRRHRRDLRKERAVDDPSPIQIVLGSFALLVMLLGWLARRHPEVAWLRTFDLRAGVSEAQRKRLQRTITVSAGAQLILLGVALPIGYVLITAVFLDEFTRAEVVSVAAASTLCVVLGVIAIVRNIRT